MTQLLAFHNDKTCKCGCKEIAPKYHTYIKNHDKRLSPLEYLIMDECWIWQRAKDKNGYGKIDNKMAHRIYYEKFVGKIPKGILVCHGCDKPSCVNPEHLFLGTQKDNVADMYKKGRALVGEKKGNHKLSKQQVISIRAEYKPNKISYPFLARKYRVSKTLIFNIINNLTWKHI